MTALRREGEWGVGSAKAGTMKGEQGNGEGEGSDGRSTLMDTRVGGVGGESHRGYRGRGKQNMYGMTACAATIGKKGQIDDLENFTEIIQMKCGVRVEYEN